MSRDPHDPDLDRALHDAFASRHVPVVDRPSVLDVQRRARRRTQRRSAAMVGCTAVVALGGAGLWAARQSGNDKDTVTAGDGAAPDATYCLPAVATTFPITATTIGFIDGTTTTMPGQPTPNDSTEILPTTAPNTIPTSTVLENAQPVATTDSGVERLPLLPVTTTTTPGDDPNSTTTTLPVNVGEAGGSGGGGGAPCFPNAPTEWHCTGLLGRDADGRDVYASCEVGYEGWGTSVVPTTIVGDGPVGTLDPLPTTTSIEPFVCPPAASCATEPTTSTIAIVGTTG